MDKILTSTVNCGTCKGSKLDPDSRHNVTLDYDLSDGVIKNYYSKYDPTKFHEYKVRLDLLDKAQVVDPCWKCKGFGVLRKGGYNAYKSQAMADKGKAAKTAERCDICYGKGAFKYVHVEGDCISCSGTGVTPVWVDGNTHVHPDVDLYKYARDFYKEWAKNVTVVVVTDNKWTWADAHLGLGSIVSCTDYGRMADLLLSEGEDAVKAKVIADFEEGRHGGDQLIKIVDKETRRIANTLAIRVTRGGYSLHAVMIDGDEVKQVDRTSYLLPPTYTDEVLNQEV